MRAYSVQAVYCTVNILLQEISFSITILVNHNLADPCSCFKAASRTLGFSVIKQYYDIIEAGDHLFCHWVRKFVHF